MSSLDTLTSVMPDTVKDIRLNLNTLVQAAEPLTATQRATVAIAVAYAQRDAPLAAALSVEAEPSAIADAQAAAALMTMNNVFYRTRHQLGAAYEQKPPRLRMNRMAQPATDAVTFELAALAVSAVNGCHVCVQAHEQSVRRHGLSDDHVMQALRVAAVVAAAVVARQISSEAQVAS